MKKTSSPLKYFESLVGDLPGEYWRLDEEMKGADAVKGEVLVEAINRFDMLHSTKTNRSWGPYAKKTVFSDSSTANYAVPWLTDGLLFVNSEEPWRIYDKSTISGSGEKVTRLGLNVVKAVLPCCIETETRPWGDSEYVDTLSAYTPNGTRLVVALAGHVEAREEPEHRVLVDLSAYYRQGEERNGRPLITNTVRVLSPLKQQKPRGMQIYWPRYVKDTSEPERQSIKDTLGAGRIKHLLKCAGIQL